MHLSGRRFGFGAMVAGFLSFSKPNRSHVAKPVGYVYSPVDMKVSAFGRAAAMAFLYIAAFVILVVVQFPSAGPISAQAGGVALKALPGRDGGGVRSAEVSVNGLRLIFSERYPLSLKDAAGKERRIVPVSYDTQADGFTVRFDDGSRLEIRADDDGRASWRLSPKPASSAVSAKFRYELSYGASQIAPGDDGAIRLSFGGSTYRVTGVSAGDDPKTLLVNAVKGSLRPFAAVREVEGKPAAPAQFIAQAPMDPAAWSKELAEWQDKAWAALSGPSFDAATASWSPLPGAPKAFDEDSFIAYMSEAMRRDRREAAASLVSVVRSTRADALSWRSAPFAGKTAGSMAAFEESTVAEVKAIERLVQAKSPSLFYKKGVVPLLFDRAPYSLAQEAVSLARALDFSKADAQQSIALIEAYLDARGYMSEEENPFSKAADLVDKAIAPSIRKADGGFFLQTSADGRCDALVGLYAGKALIRLAEAVGRPIYAGIGQSLVVSILRLASGDGSIPASVSIVSGALQRSEERLPAATAYPIVAESPYLPRAISFFKQLGPGAWAWTCASGARVTASPEKTVITVDYPVGSSHYLTLYGVKPFVKIQLYGLDYNMDASFENYNASGYFYKKAAGAMYLKMRHKAPGEDVRLFY